MLWEIAAITLVFIALDVVSGFAQAVANKCLDSSKMRSGLWHKAGFLLVMCLAALVEWSMGVIDIGFAVPTFTPVCTFIILTEIVSVFENACKLSPELANSKVAQLFSVDPNK